MKPPSFFMNLFGELKKLACPLIYGPNCWAGSRKGLYKKRAM
jgi:hypothetical protein